MYNLFMTESEYNNFKNGTWSSSFHYFGAHRCKENGITGYHFAVWAPNAKSVYVTGSFCSWDPKANAMLLSEQRGVWHLFIPELHSGDLYKYVIETQSGDLLYKADPYAFYAQIPPETASRLTDIDSYQWHDSLWLANRKKKKHREHPFNIYEVHLGSWKRNMDGSYYTYSQLAEELIPYAVEMGYTHLELMPVMEYPFDGSWGYQTTGYYAATSRYGSPQDFMSFVDSCHCAGLGVILDWVPGHFCRDAHGLAGFCGEMVYEKEIHPQWGTYKFNYERGEVRSFLISNAHFWIEAYHADGIRVDGVTSMLYLNFGVDDPKFKQYNADGSEENRHAIQFLRDLNQQVGVHHPDIIMIAEESTAWPLVTYPPENGGLGFHYKWDMGWMHDTLHYMQTDFPYRPSNHKLLTFSMMYNFNENFILALSHDEVVHGKCSLIQRMPGDYWRQFAGMRLLYLYQMCHPGAKMNFMGNEIAQYIEWRYYEGIEFFLTQYESHEKYQQFVKTLNSVYKQEPALWQLNYSWEGFEWLDADNVEQSTLAFVRRGRKQSDELIVLLNFAPETVNEFRLGVPKKGNYIEIFNSDDVKFGGSGRVNIGVIKSEQVSMHGKNDSVVIRTPPVGGLILKRFSNRKHNN